MKIIFIQPPNLQRSGNWQKQMVYRTPTNLAILASCARKAGYPDVSILDFDVHGGTVESIAESVAAQKPDLIAFTCLTPRFPAIVKIAQKCKEKLPELSVVIGGPHVNGIKEKALDVSSIDYAVIGEGETAFIELLNAIRDNSGFEQVHNLIYRKAGVVTVNARVPVIEDLDSIPFPAWDLLDLKAYTDPSLYKGAHAGIMTGRGCPYDCIFCASQVTWGKKVRLRTPGNVVDEIEELVNKYKINEFMFYDDTFTIDIKRASEICELILKKGLKIRFYIQSRADTMSLDLAILMKKAGCIGVAIGVESGDEKILSQVGKHETKEQIRKAVQIFKQAKLPCVASYVIGLPGDTRETIQATIDFANELDTDQAKFMIATPYPGTRLFNMAKERGLLKLEDIEDLGDYTFYQHVAANLSNVTDEELKTYQRNAYNEYDKRKRDMSGNPV